MPKKKKKSTPKPAADPELLAQMFSGPEPTEHVSLIFTPREKFWEWMAEDSNLQVEIPAMKKQLAGDTCILVHDYGSPGLIREYCESRFVLFMAALFGGFISDPDLWPKISSYSELEIYFEIRFVPVVVELEPMNLELG